MMAKDTSPLARRHRRHSHVCPCHENIRTQSQYFIKLLTKFAKAKSLSLKKSILKKADPCFIRYLCNCAKGLLHTHIKVPQDQYPDLSSSKDLILELAKNKQGIEKKRELLLKHKGGFFPILAGIASAAVGNILSSLLTNG